MAWMSFGIYRINVALSSLLAKYSVGPNIPRSPMLYPKRFEIRSMRYENQNS